MTHEHHAGSFFVLRTPLLPFETLLEWAAAGDDETALLAHLRALAKRPEIAEAVMLASESLSTALAEPEPSKRVLLALSRYLCRMASRPTPFALFAGCSVGALDGATRLELPPIEQYARSTGAGMDLLVKLAESIDDETRARAPLVPTSTRYELAGQLRYVDERGIEHPLRATRAGRELRAALQLTDGQRSANDLAAELARNLSAPVEPARKYIDGLIANQILFPDVHPRVTAADPAGDLAARLHAIGAPQAATVESLTAELRRIDEQRAGAADYTALRREIEAVSPGTPLNEALHVVLHKPSDSLSLDRGIAGGLLDAAEMLRRLFARPEMDSLHNFREKFLARYEMRFVPLLEALDEELGLGVAGFGDAGTDDLPLLEDVPLRTLPEKTWFGPAHKVLLEKVGHALRDNDSELVIDPSDIERMSIPDPMPLPDSFAAIGTLTESQFVLYAFSGPSGAQFLGRFCHSSERLTQCVQEWLRDEERLAPDAIFAEVVALPDGRDANVVVRPSFTEHEIPFLGRSSRPREQQIEACDLLVGVKDGRLRLWSRSRNREVIARVTNAHNFRARGVSAYRFLGALQRQRVAGTLAWDWGPLWEMPYLPRVRFGNVILQRAKWTVHPTELKPLLRGTQSERRKAARALAEQRRMPRFVLFSEGDNDLLVDWQNVVTVDACLALVKEDRRLLFHELYPAPDQLAVRGPEGRFTNEAVIPFVRSEPRRARQPLVVRETPLARRFVPPGGAWLYWKLYTGYSTADRLLADTIAPALQRLRADGLADAWFFIRYGDPEFHIRLRVREGEKAAGDGLMRALSTVFAPLLEAGWVDRLQLDTYNREVERYGGVDQMEIVEELFAADSMAVVKMLPYVQNAPELRWQVAAYGTDRLLDDVGVTDPEAKRALFEQLSADYGRELGDSKATREALAKKVRTMRPQLDALFADPALRPWQEVYDERTRAIAALELHLDRRSPFTDGIAASLVHMHLNRIFRSMPRAQERVLYDLLHRRYCSLRARRERP